MVRCAATSYQGVMGLAVQNLFHTIVVIGSTLGVGCASRGETFEPTPDPQNADRKPDREAGQPDAAEESSGDDAANCECAGEGVECQGNGMLCCWATDPCCEPCCPDL